MKYEININDFVFQLDDSKTGFGKLISELNIAKNYSEKHKKKSLIISEKSIHGNIKKEAQRLNYQHLQGIEAEVVWNKDKGLYEFKYVEVRRGTEFPGSDNFYGVHKFELIKK